MTAIVAKASVACDMPALLRDMMELNDLVVVPDENWEALLDWTRENLLLPGKDVTLIETDKGPFLIIPDEDIDQSKRTDERV